jgi:hypothetical protein
VTAICMWLIGKYSHKQKVLNLLRHLPPDLTISELRKFI